MRFWLVNSLAVWRLTRMAMRERGPYDVFETVRYKLRDTTWGDMLKCRYCTSVWVGWIVALSKFTPRLRWIIDGLALSQLSLMWQNWWGKDV